MNGLHCAFTGRIGQEPEPRYTQGGKPLLTFSVAVDEHTTATEQRPAPETQWVRVTAWERQAEQLADVLHKGSAVYVEGRLRLSTWETREGEPRCGLNVSAWKVEPLGAIGRQAPRREA